MIGGKRWYATTLKGQDSGTSPVQDQPLIIPLQGAPDYERSLVGGKAAGLGILMRAKLPVPPGFCVTSAAFSEFLNSSPKLKEQLIRSSSKRPIEETSRTPKSGETPALVEIPVAIKEAILRVWRAMGKDRHYAVRSSATVEDGTDHSFAGQFESVLNVQGEEALLSAVQKCWVSVLSPRAVSYHARKGLRPEDTSVAVVVQEMVRAEVAGVMFTMDPISGDRGRLVVEAAPGLGDVTVSGKNRPERFVLEKRTFRMLEHHCVSDASCLNESLLRKVSSLAERAERLFGMPLDIEWATSGGDVFLLQARPVTAARQLRSWEERQRWSNVNTGEVFPDVATPMTWSIVQLLFEPLFGSLFRVAGADPSRMTVAGLVAGRIYFNVNAGLALLNPFRFLMGGLANVAQAIGGGRAAEHMRGLLQVPDSDLPETGFHWHLYLLTWPRILYDLITHAPFRAEAWLQGVKSRTDNLVRQDVQCLSTSELFKCLAHARREGFRGWDLLYLITQSGALPIFQKACRDWLHHPDLSLGYRLFAGLGGIPETEAGLELWRLAVAAHANEEVEAALRSGADWSRVQIDLTASEAGKDFLAAWDKFMAKHGHHGRGELEVFNARWAETPDYILRLVRGYLGELERGNPEEKQRRLAEERRRLTEECRAQLGPLRRWVFTIALRRAQKLAVHREAWKNEAVRLMYFIRRLLLELGRHLHDKAVLNDPDDIFFLEIAELESLGTGTAPSGIAEQIKSRREKYRENLNLCPPPYVVGRFTSASSTTTLRTPNHAAKVLEGIAVSSGVATGRARVILRTDDHEQTLPGEILVAPFTDPAWVPYFIPAAGVVMDQGGVLSHGSIIARELGLPAVTDTGSATHLIQTGDMVQVDGNCGQVTILAAATRA